MTGAGGAPCNAYEVRKWTSRNLDFREAISRKKGKPERECLKPGEAILRVKKNGGHHSLVAEAIFDWAKPS
jgi:hypothetical protein